MRDKIKNHKVSKIIYHSIRLILSPNLPIEVPSQNQEPKKIKQTKSNSRRRIWTERIIDPRLQLVVFLCSTDKTIQFLRINLKRRTGGNLFNMRLKFGKIWMNNKKNHIKFKLKSLENDITKKWKPINRSIQMKSSKEKLILRKNIYNNLKIHQNLSRVEKNRQKLIPLWAIMRNKNVKHILKKKLRLKFKISLHKLPENT